jgi:hypothetical protein
LVLICEIIDEKQRVLHFDLQGNFMYDIFSDDLYFSRNMVYLNDSTYLTYNDGGIVPQNMSLLYLDAMTMNIRHQSNSINEFFFNSDNRCISINNSNILCLAYNDSIYDISDRNNVYAKYLIYFSDMQVKNKKQMHENTTNDPFLYENKLKTIMQNYFDGENVLVSSIYENDKYLAISCLKLLPNTNNSIYYTVFYSKLDKKAYNSDNIDFNGFKLYNCVIRGIKNQAFYCVLPEISLEDKEKIKNSSVFSEDDKQKLLAYKEDDNPVLVILK